MISSLISTDEGVIKMCTVFLMRTCITVVADTNAEHYNDWKRNTLNPVKEVKSH